MLKYVCCLFGLVAIQEILAQTEEYRQRRVTIPPLITEMPDKKMTFREEESIELPCAASGEPEPEYYWELNGALFSPSGNDGRIAVQPGKGTLIFARPIERDEGIYQCFATNKHGVATTVKVDLRVGILSNFPSNTEITRTHSVDLGMPLTLPCTPPQSYPPAQVFWATVASGAGFTPIDLTDRVSIDPIGNLHFANVQSRDEQGGRQFVCIVQNKVMRRTQHGSYQKIITGRGVPERRPPSILWAHPKDQVALRGETWRVKCIFSGSPTPRVIWTRDGKPMPTRKREESFGQELVIEGVQYEDEGQYECQGINEGTSSPIRRSFQLRVESMPFWVDMPESVNAAEGATAVFHCRSDGLPEPTNFWFINGTPIAKVEADERRVVEKNKITFFNVTNSDAKVIQCNSTNDHGYIFANAFLNVQTEPPFILVPPAVGQRVAEGQTVQLTCSVFGSPRPLIIWTKAGEQLTGGRFKVMEDGNLEIEDVSLVDAGEYTCTATNRLDTVSDTGSLIVRRKTRIRTPPLDVMIYEGTEAKFTCTATTDPEEIKNLQIEWMKDGQIIDYRLAQRVFRNDMDNSLTISGTITLDTGKYTCRATNGLDYSEESAQLVVQAPPDAPMVTEVRCYENALPGRADIEWQTGKENYAPILNYIVQFNTSFAPDTWITLVQAVNQTDRKFSARLSPYGNYTFRVLARNKIGVSQPSEHSKTVCTTLEDVPNKNPENVIGEGDEPDNLVIYWTPMPKIEQNGPNFKYIVTWKRNDTDDAMEESDTVELSEAYHYVVPRKQPTYKPYEITVRAKNSVGDSRVAPVKTLGYSGEDVPLEEPRNVQVREEELQSTSARLFWDPVDTDPEVIRGFFRGYRIQFWKTKEGPESMREVDYIVNAPKQYPRPRNKRQIEEEEYTLNNLPPYADITIMVRVLNKYYVGPPSEPVFVRTKEGEPGPPIMFDVIARGSTHFELVWEPPEEPNGVLSSYFISYQQITGLNLGRLQYRDVVDDPEQNRARLTGLQPETDYRIFLSAATASGKGEPIFLDARTTHAGPPSKPTFEIMEIAETWADVMWEPSRGGNPGSVFYVQYRPRSQYHWLHSPDEVLSFTLRLQNLDPGTTYQARVVSKNGAGDEAPAEWQEFTTGGLGPGRVELKTALWFYLLLASLIFLILFMVGFIFAKRLTDSWWEAKEAILEEQMRQLQAEEVIRQMGIVNQYVNTGSREMIDTSYGDPSADYYNKPPIPDDDEYDDDDDVAAGFGEKVPYDHQHHQPTEHHEPYINPDPYHQEAYQQQQYQPPPTTDRSVGYHPGVGYAPPSSNNQYSNVPVHRSSPSGHADAYVQDGQYHLQSDKVADDSSPSFV